MKRYLVTGGAGFIGTAITKKLIQNGDFVRVLDDQSRGSKQSLPETSNLEFFQADIRDAKKVSEACRNIDSIIHLAFVNGTKYFYEKPEVVLEIGVKGMVNVLDCAKDHHIQELFLSSSSEVYQTPPVIPTPEDVPYFIPDAHNPRYSYAGGKIISELLSIHMGRKIFKRVVIFRPHNVYGPAMGAEHVIPELIKKILTLQRQLKKNISLPIQGSGNQTRAFIYIDDFVDALGLLLKKGRNGEIYNIGTNEEISINDLITKIDDILKLHIIIKHEALPQGSVLRRCPDITKIKTLGFRQKISIRSGLEKTLHWYRDSMRS